MANKENKPQRITLPLTADGENFDFETMRSSQKERFAKLVNDNASEILAAGGYETVADGEAGAEIEQPDLFGGISQENIRTGLDILSQANALALKIVAPMVMKHPFKKDSKTGKPLPFVLDVDVLQQAFMLSEEQHKELDPRALKVAQKYSGHMPEWLKKNLDVYMLCGMYLRYTAANAQKAIQVQFNRDLELAKQEKIKQAAVTRRPIKPDSDSPSNGEAGLEPPTPPTATGGIGEQQQL